MTRWFISAWSVLQTTTPPSGVAKAIMSPALTTLSTQMMICPSNKVHKPTSARKWLRWSDWLDGTHLKYNRSTTTFFSEIDDKTHFYLLPNALSLLPSTHSRERNRVHARNTRERKKSQMDGLQSRIQELVDEVGVLFRSLMNRQIMITYTF